MIYTSFEGRKMGSVLWLISFFHSFLNKKIVAKKYLTFFKMAPVCLRIERYEMALVLHPEDYFVFVKTKCYFVITK